MGFRSEILPSSTCRISSAGAGGEVAPGAEDAVVVDDVVSAAAGVVKGTLLEAPSLVAAEASSPDTSPRVVAEPGLVSSSLSASGLALPFELGGTSPAAGAFSRGLASPAVAAAGSIAAVGVLAAAGVVGLFVALVVAVAAGFDAAGIGVGVSLDFPGAALGCPSAAAFSGAGVASGSSSACGGGAAAAVGAGIAYLAARILDGFTGAARNASTLSRSLGLRQSST